MANQYYYLIAGLPDIAISDKKLMVGVDDFRERLDEELLVDDRHLVKLWFLPFDHANIVNLLFVLRKPFDERGNFRKSLVEQMVDRKLLDEGPFQSCFPYINEVVEFVLSSDDALNADQVEMMLAKGYYQLLMDHENEFVRQYATFDLNLRNVLTALNGRKFNLMYDDQLIGDEFVRDALVRSRARDFGLSGEIYGIETWVQVFEIENLLERELKIDMLRWAFIGDAVFFNYFSIEKVLAFVLKLMIVDRWLSLDEEKGRELFMQLLADLEKGYVFPDEYKLKHG
jgi:hypothetical protein